MPDRVSVYVRVAPRDESRRHRAICKVINTDSILLSSNPKRQTTFIRSSFENKEEKIFKFDKCFDEGFGKINSQSEFYKGSINHFVKDALNGYNCCILAYGQTGSGKTYTMMGESKNDTRGVIPRFCEDLFHEIESIKIKDSSDLSQRSEYKVVCSIFEIYNEQIIDLLEMNEVQSCSKYRVRENRDRSMYIENITEIEVSNIDQMIKCVKMGFRNRTTRSTNMNVNSSRSHAIVSITIKRTDIDLNTNSSIISDSICRFVDLAGSERSTATQNCHNDRLKEGNSINKSLSTLRRVLTSLKKREELKYNSNSNSSAHNIVVPFRESLLTWILKDNLGGNSKTCIIACISPTNFEESASTLRYADIAQTIKTNSIINTYSNTTLLDNLQKQLRIMEIEVNKLQKDQNSSLELQYILNNLKLENKFLEKNFINRANLSSEMRKLLIDSEIKKFQLMKVILAIEIKLKDPKKIDAKLIGRLEQLKLNDAKLYNNFVLNKDKFEATVDIYK
ncbi:hypothetical protein Kpol_1004p25 [Vanderwaltozyma polyspora DSM 70294]|uniref:Kinesin motor domain-containing protein n=1 Tax=Vanderwaltozyma polyspora (strain ATCC 22028 / DSM 70294 / BCRC 21397 / CBS 2163 / NBRC 10782 / NRRL Y-8283 / UCD 57-17) TaxID=436907 RepID=A7TJ82_VANPO|nr:uncharacterized protein Kpol_1004p25 [Vanderwaltozyma polyspora DSM 70294]EDO17651.1 hypothetical protein Kpol_1004p25 [Vanderwaltozyma polyspora DSM 70294]